jgi:CheY-like chemotaxis protein
LLASHGHYVTEAVDGVEFLHCLGYEIEGDQAVQMAVHENNNNNFDVILIDENMPRLNGSNAVALVRHAGYSGIIIGITGNAEMDSIQSFKDKGADDVLSKPIDLQQLKKRIEQLLARNKKA